MNKANLYLSLIFLFTFMSSRAQETAHLGTWKLLSQRMTYPDGRVVNSDSSNHFQLKIYSPKQVEMMSVDRVNHANMRNKGPYSLKGNNYSELILKPDGTTDVTARFTLLVKGDIMYQKGYLPVSGGKIEFDEIYKKIGTDTTSAFLNGSTAAQTLTALPDTFQNVLNLGKMTFAMPKNAIPIPLVKNMQMHYEYAITFKDQPFEVRYSVAPVGYTVAEAYTGGKGITPRQDSRDNEFGAKVSSMVVATNVAGGRATEGMGTNPFPPEAVKKEFGADWGSTTVIPIGNNSFGTEYKFCVMTTLFKKDAATAYIMYLSDTKENLMKLMGELIVPTGAFYALKFK